MTLLDTILRPWRTPQTDGSTALKAAIGPGVAMVEYGIPLADRTNTAQWLRKAQKISHVGWPAVAERIVSGTAAGVPWHLEDPEGNTIDKTSPPAYQAVWDLMKKPMGADFTRPSQGGMRLTQRGLWRLTLRHMGVCNVAFWFLSQGDLLAGTPLEILYINPARMTPATDRNDNLIGWVLDADNTYSLERGNIRGIPLTLDEVVPFWLEPPDFGYYGVGLVEMALAKIRMADAGDRFLTDTFSTGGRRGSFIGPKQDRMPDEVFDALVSGLRNVAERPDSAKRNIVAKGPIDVIPQASTPDELQIYEIVSMTRDDILGHWGVPLTQTGIPAPAGLNSGETRKYDEASLWQNAVHPRLDPFRETVQLYVLDRFAELGVEVSLVLDEPSFDDEAPLYELAEKAKVIPLIDNERRALVGHDPWPDFDEVTGQPLGAAIRLPNNIILAGIGPSEGPRPAQLRIVSPEELPPPEENEEPAQLESGAKAWLPLREEIHADVPAFADRISEFLAQQRSSVLNRLTERARHLMRRPSDIDAWWSPRRWDLALAGVLTPRSDDIARKVATATRARLAAGKGKADEFTDAAIAAVRDRAGDRITGINGTTRDAILAEVRAVIEEAVEDGLSPDEAADLLTDRVGNLSVWNEARSELVARTETMFAYNDAALTSFKQLEVGRVLALDGDKDAECAARDGQTFSIDDAFSISDHPNGTLDWAPA